MKNAEKNRDPERAQKRAAADAKCAWRKMNESQRVDFLGWIGVEQETHTLGHHEAWLASIAQQWAE